MGIARGDHVRYTAAPVFDELIRTGDVGIVTAATDGGVCAKWPNGHYTVPVKHVRRIRRVRRAVRVAELVTWLREQRDTVIEPGLDEDEIARAEAYFAITFPSLWRDVLAQVHPVDPDIGAPDAQRCPAAWYPDWRLREPGRTGRMVRAPVEGVVHDVEHDGFWWHAWGTRPADPSDAVAVARARLASAPSLAPLFDTFYAAPAAEGTVFWIRRTEVRIPAARVADLPIHDGRDVTAIDERPAGGAGFWSELHAYATSGPADAFGRLASRGAK